MKRTILFLVILALLVPAAAMAQTEFTLGGFVKLETFWDSTQASKNMLTPIARNNDPSFQHGRFRMTAQGSRFNLTIKGPKLWGAQVTGFFEMDFDSEQELGSGSANATSASQNYKPRLRHAMFRLNWPETELLLGQYWSMFCEYYPESAQDGPYNNHGVPTARLPQIRVTQKFLGAWTVAGLIGQPNASGFNLVPYNATGGGSSVNNGEAAEGPQVQGKIQYQQDLWGKAAFYGRPMPFTAQVVAGWQRSTFRPAAFAARSFGEFGFNPFFTVGDTNFAAVLQKNHQNLNNWMIQGTLFVPVIPTYSANLAGTASLSTQWYVGQGLDAFGEATGPGSAFWRFLGVDMFGVACVEEQLMKRYGGYIQAQYYFNNQWFLNAVWGMDKAFNVGRSSFVTTTTDPYNMWQEFDVTLWYRPITAIKFGLQYSYGRTNYFQKIRTPVDNALGGNVDFGEEHRVTFAGFFYF